MGNTEIVLNAMVYVLPAVCLIILLLMVLFILKFIINSKSVQRYLDAFSSTYKKEGNVMAALENSLAAFKTKSREAQAIRKSIFYINHSILHDYQTAFSMIEKVIKGKKVKQLHAEVLKQEKEKKNTMLLLTTKY